tara:strand:- start:29 stop:763 length:735 start_codon:yes stop_codon:yes gene_type:complete
MAATKGIPIAAFAGQNHDAHIQVKTAYIQDPSNGANPIMQRIQPILQANMQEHSVMKYQEQMNGLTKEMMNTVPQEGQTPAAIEMAMAQAAQQITNANQAMGMAQSPEQQLVALEQEKVKLQQQKLQSDTATNAAELELKNKKLELEENEQILGMIKTNATDNLKREKATSDRESKEKLKEMEVISKASLEEFKLNKEEEQEVMRSMKEILLTNMKENNQLDLNGLDALVKMAQAQQKESQNDG